MGLIDLRYLRGEINVVLQQPFVIQTESIRQNLDPRKLCSDREIEMALLDAGIFQAPSTLR